MSDVIGGIISLVDMEGVTPHGLRKFWEQNSHYEHEAYHACIASRKSKARDTIIYI